MSDNAITQEDRHLLSEFILNTDRFTNGPKVKEFEKAWSQWQGCKYSVYVNSGSSANLLAVDTVRNIYGDGVCIAQGNTWPTNVTPICQLKGLLLQLCDVDLNNFGPCLDTLKKIFDKLSPSYLFLTHLLGFPSITDDLINMCKDYGVLLMEDCCESPGATWKSEKVGNFGVLSTFSFYYSHHMTTIEGGMVCTNDENIYRVLLLLRSHGLLREVPQGLREDLIEQCVDENWTFVRQGYNFRGTEIGAVLGLNQLKRLDTGIQQRNQNLAHLMSCLDSSKFKTDFNLEGVSSFYMPIISDVIPKEKLVDRMRQIGVDSRPIIGGNLYLQPMIKNVNQFIYDDNIKFLDKNGVCVGNHQDVYSSDISRFCEEVNKL